MQKKKSNSNQIAILIIALIIALTVIIILAVILSNKIRSASDDVKINSVGTSLPLLDNEVNEKSNSNKKLEAEEEIITTVEDIIESDVDLSENEENITSNSKSASEYILYTSKELFDEFNNVYESSEYVDGNYAIYNYDIAPNMQFYVQEKAEDIILDQKIMTITVTSDGKVMDNITVGMTYKEMKDVLGDKLVPIEQDEENCMFAFCEMENFTVTFEFEFSGGKSINAIVKVIQ